jgi:hypothetical protein
LGTPQPEGIAWHKNWQIFIGFLLKFLEPLGIMREKSKKIICGILENKMPTRASILSFEMAYGILGIGSAPSN